MQSQRTKEEKATKSWVGFSVRRKEDAPLLTGTATYVDDIHLDGMLYASFVRSAYAHARIQDVNFSSIANSKSIAYAASGKDLAVRIRPWMKLQDLKDPEFYSLAPDIVRYVGEPVAVVVADTRYSAEDGSELVDVEYAQLSPVLDPEQALLDKKHLVFESWGDNVLYSKHYTHGDPDKAISNAAVVIREKLTSQRHGATPIEPRGIVANYNKGTGELTVWLGNQLPHVAKAMLSETLSIDENRIRLIAPWVGGGFGTKASLYPDEVAVCQLSILLGKPVKWIETRSEHMISSAHARDQVHYVEAGFDSQGNLLGMKDKIVADFGAGGGIWTSIAPAIVTCGSIPGPYRFENFSYDLFCIATNKTPYGAHRGFGRPVASYVMERVMDMAAHKLGIDPVLIRSRNLVRKEEMPFRSASGLVYDSGDYSEALNRLVDISGYRQFRREQAEARRNGRFVGIGLGFYVEFTAPNSASIINTARNIGGHEVVELAFNSDGTLIAKIGVANQGQSHKTIFAQVIAQELNLDINDISIVEGDTASTPFGFGAIASRSTPTVGGAAILAARKLKPKLLRAASTLLGGSNLYDLELDFRSVVDKKSGKSISIKELARISVRTPTRLNDIEPGFATSAVYEAQIPPSSYGIHAVTVEVDRSTGGVKILKYAIVEDSGVIINPMTAHGQVHGALAHGIGGAMLEEFSYDQDGQLKSSTFIDYLIPTSTDVPDVVVENIIVPSLSVGGFKGMGEGATIPVAAAISNAVEDALGMSEHPLRSLPLSPMNVYNLMHES